MLDSKHLGLSGTQKRNLHVLSMDRNTTGLERLIPKHELADIRTKILWRVPAAIPLGSSPEQARLPSFSTKECRICRDTHCCRRSDEDSLQEEC